MLRAILTLATGKPAYIKMAVNLARSFRWWHRRSDIKFVLATDQKQLLPSDLGDIDVIELGPNQFGTGFTPKLYLDQLAPAQQTLFIDADCLCVGNLEQVFARFAGRKVSVVGGSISSGEWFGDVEAICRKFSVPALPKFNGGLYYLEKGELSSRVYTTARELLPQYDALGLVRLRNHANDELLLAIAMALHGQTALPDDGSIFCGPLSCPGPLALDVLHGGSRLENPPPPSPKHRASYPLNVVHPVVVHFLGGTTSEHPYRREELRLELALARGWPVVAAGWAGVLARSLTKRTARGAKDAFRPVYRRCFGVRAVAKSDRV